MSSESSNDRPSDLVVQIDSPSIKERPGSPISKSLQRPMKKGRSQDATDVPQVDMMMHEALVVDGIVEAPLGGQSYRVKLGCGSDSARPSFRDMVTGDYAINEEKKVVCDLEVQVLDSDVVNRRRRVAPLKKDNLSHSSVEVVNGRNKGSQFSALTSVQEDREAVVSNVPGSSMRGKSVMVSPMPIVSSLVGSGHTESSRQGEECVSSFQVLQVIPEEVEPVVMESTKSAQNESLSPIPVASAEVVEPVATSLDKTKHVAIRTIDKGSSRVLRESNGRVLPASLRGGSTAQSSKSLAASKGVVRKGLKPKKKGDKVPPKPVLAEFVSAMTAELNSANANLVRDGVPS
ncbi:hypothetical protein V6N11_034373 [Hibiscus sabdariffa]|uniref:Uncharacterized protein n=2 Tax=Hibiscus sabdariffa TaxID=183260 RepID=A0ABR2AUA9_9ROSI